MLGARLAIRENAASKTGCFLRYFKQECSLTMSINSVYSVVDVSDVAMFSNLDGTCVCDNLRLGSSASYGGLNQHDVYDNGVPGIAI